MNTALVALAEEYSRSRLSILKALAQNRAKERLIDLQTRTVLRMGRFPKWFAMYYDSEEKDGLLLLSNVLAAWDKTDFEPDELQKKWLGEAEKASQTMARLRSDRSLLQSMRNETAYAIVEICRHLGIDPDIRVKRDAGRLVKTRVKPVDYLDSVKNVAVDDIEKLFETTDGQKRVQEISLDHLSVMERVCFRASVEIRMSYGEIADELSKIARAVADELGITGNVGLGKDSVATHVQNAHRKLLKERYQKRIITEETGPNSPLDEYEREVRRRFSLGLYLAKPATQVLADTVQVSFIL